MITMESSRGKLPVMVGRINHDDDDDDDDDDADDDSGWWLRVITVMKMWGRAYEV